MVKVKICGLMCMDDIQAVNALLPDYAGFVFAEGKHHLSLQEAVPLCERLDDKIKKVGIFVDETIENINEIVKACGLDIVQLCGGEGQNTIDAVEAEVWKAIRVRSKEDLFKVNERKANAFLLDTYVKGIHGGSGQVFDWELAKDTRGKIILAGGLTSENVAKAIQIVNPYAVDVSSGVETNGVKDYDKLKSFIEKARRM